MPDSSGPSLAAARPAPPAPVPVRSPFAGARVAVIHDWFQGFHGAERVVEAITEDVFAAADAVDVFCFSATDEVIPPHLAARIVRRSRLSRLPGIRQRGHRTGRWRVFLPVMPRYFRSLDLSGYDVVVASSHACALQARPPAGAVHVCYSHTPMRYAWLTDVDRDRVPGLQGTALGLMRGRLRASDYAAAQRVGSFVANSSAVAERISSLYGRPARVIHPPVDVADFAIAAHREPGHVLWAHRMVAYKHPLEVMEAFRGLPGRLSMVGVGPLHAEVAARAPANVDVHGWLEREAFVDLYARASAFIHIGEEDFGITMVEALAAGLPVIALNRGGARDIIRPGLDGVLVEEATVPALRRALEEVAATSWSPEALRRRAHDFSRARFVERFGAHVAGLLGPSDPLEPPPAPR